ncbi:5-dehydro-2-deoxygluconokinase [Flaviflexus equikiangi]|uniref:5-dehydro-2-deoxygluconokinase n=1 Tax=Flaviflexus equikiangi TaxID=2758573 RepID=UPI00217512E4|nr:5-dehydro-2-deoxygluconokinase [Flaviflexus equikiangi]
MSAHIDVLTIGRSGVDIYPLQVGIGLEEVSTFGKFLGGSPTNIAVAAARLGHTAAAITGVGDDPFGRFVRNEMRSLGVRDDYVVVNRDFNTPVTFCEIFPPDHFPLYFYREPSAPDLQLRPSDIPGDAVRDAHVFLLSGTGLSQEPSRSAHRHALSVRNKKGWTIADLDYRPMFWESSAVASREISSILDRVNVAVGNREECWVAVGEDDPDRAADALLERGVEIAIVKQGPKGTLAKTADERIEVPVTEVKTLNGLGAGDAFAGALAHALIEQWDIPRAIQFASTAGSIVVSRLECSAAMPREDEVFALMAQHPRSAPVVRPRT